MKNDGTNLLWYTQSATTWNEALPLGNGRIGAMIYGNAVNERIFLNEDTLWSGVPSYYQNPDGAEIFQSARDLALKHCYCEAQSLLDKEFSNHKTQVYLPLGELRFDMEHPGSIDNYRRELDISTGIHTVHYDCLGVHYTREYFISHPDQVLVVRLTADQPQKLTFSMSLVPALDAVTKNSKDSSAITGNCPCYRYSFDADGKEYSSVEYGTADSKKGIGYYAEARIVQEGGSTTQRGGFRIEQADCAVIYFGVRTSFNGWDKHPVLEGKPYVEPCVADLDAAIAKQYEELRSNHLADYRNLYDRVSLDLGGGEEKYLPTDERLYRHENGEEDLALYTLFFNYGRYLTIASSRKGTQPTNLQGIWNDHFAAPWNSNYTVNINTQMNYWPTLMTGLTECYEPLLRMIEELSVSGQRTAMDYYGAPGFVVHHNTDLWRLTTPVGSHKRLCSQYAFWPLASGWFVRHMWEYYEYTRDLSWLQNTGWPIIQKAAAFYQATLTEDADGYLVMAPSTSPENLFLAENRLPCSVSVSAAMTQEIIYDVFDICRQANRILKLADPFVAKLESIIPKLKPLCISREGALLEWSEDLEEKDVHHRHISHLYALHPARKITFEDTPDLAEACMVTLNRRGDESTGWAMGWRINCWARLGNGDRALKLLDMQLRTAEGHNPERQNASATRFVGGTYLNLLDAHPPFQIDGNFGACSGIVEMLLQVGSNGALKILPALPKAWRKGNVRGLRVFGDKTVNIAWNQDTGFVDVKEY